jgi:hypothetical protein
MAVNFPMLTYITREDWLDRAKRSVREAERWEAQAEGIERSPLRWMRDELLLAQAEASIAIAEALTVDKQPDPNEPSKLKGYDYACEEPREPDDDCEFVSCTVVPASDSLARREEWLDWLREHVPDIKVISSITNVADRYMVVESYMVDHGGQKVVDNNFKPGQFVMEKPFAVAIHRPMPRGWSRETRV